MKAYKIAMTQQRSPKKTKTNTNIKRHSNQ